MEGVICTKTYKNHYLYKNVQVSREIRENSKEIEGAGGEVEAEKEGERLERERGDG